jgi:hypothetical protein
MGGVARVVVVADCQSEVFERRQRVAMFGLDVGKSARHMRLIATITAILSDYQAPAQGLTRTVGVGIAEGEAVGEKRVRKPPRVVGGLGGVDQAGRGGHRLAIETGRHECDEQACPGEYVCVASASQLGAEQLDRPFGLADHQVRSV